MYMEFVKLLKQNHLKNNKAGALLIQDIPVVFESALMKEIKVALKKQAKKIQTINYIYVVNKKMQLVGVFSIKELFRQKNDVIVKDVMHRQIVSARINTPLQRLVFLCLKQNIKAIPLVDKNDKLLGIVPSDAILSILYIEHQKRLTSFAGLHDGMDVKENILTLSLFKSVLHRLPWLLTGLFGVLLVAIIISKFESLLEKHVLIASFIPLMLYMSGACALQIVILYVRDMTFHHKLPLKKYTFKLLTIVFFIALILSSIVYLFLLFSSGDIRFSFAIAISLFFCLFSSIFTGFLIPNMLHLLKLDPALASGPLVTLVQDVISIIIFFSLTSLLL